MASSSLSSLLHVQSPFISPSIHTHPFYRNPYNISYPRHCLFARKQFIKTPLAITESGSPKSLDPDPQTLLQDIADKFVLPIDYFSKLPRDLRLDLNDAAFDLSNGPVKDECGEELGQTLLNISRAWEQGDASTSSGLVRELPSLLTSLTESNKSALGKRLMSSGRRFQAMGQYGKGELEMIAQAMIRAGKLLSAKATGSPTTEQDQKRTLKIECERLTSRELNLPCCGIQFGALQVELTSNKAYIGAAIGFVFGILSWELGQGVQNIPESTMEYANDNALMLAKSLRGALLAISYSSAILSAFVTGALILLGGQLRSKEK